MTTDFNLAIAASGSLLERAEAALRAQWTANPNVMELSWKLGETLRQMGRLDEALDVFRRALNLFPRCEKLDCMVRILSGRGPGQNGGLEFFPAPFVLIDKLLPDELVADIWKCILSNKGNFVPSQIGNIVDPHVRNSNVLYEQYLEPVKHAVLDRVRGVLHDSCDQLGMDGHVTGNQEIQVTQTADGGFYNAHRDNDLGPDGSSRSITYVIYMFRTPPGYTGGDLILYDWNEQQEGYASRFTRIVPRNNALVLFPSAVWHQVTPVKSCNAGFEFSRFTINGWLHRGATT